MGVPSGCRGRFSSMSSTSVFGREALSVEVEEGGGRESGISAMVMGSFLGLGFLGFAIAAVGGCWDWGCL